MCDFRKPEEILTELKKQGITVTYKGGVKDKSQMAGEGLYRIIASGSYYVLVLNNEVMRI